MSLSKYALLRSNPGMADYQNQRKLINTYVLKEHSSVINWIKDSPKNKHELLEANSKLVKIVKVSSWLVISELSMLGPSFVIVSEVLIKLLRKNIRIYSVKEKIALDSTKMAQLRTGLEICQKIDKSLIAQRIVKGRARLKVSGKSTGRPKGKKAIRTKLSGKEKQVQEYLNSGHGFTTIGRLLGVNRITVKTFIVKHGLLLNKNKK